MSGEKHRLRLAAILAADAAGYSRLMAVDEHATVAALDAARAVFRAQIESNQGRVIDMAGDSVLALFDTAKGAVGAALAVQKSLNETAGAVPEERRMRFRVGVHLGDVIEKGDGTVYGDGVNIAARLESLAAPGGITVSDSVRNAVHGKVSAAFEDQGQQTVKNIAEPVRAFRVIVTSVADSKPSATVGAIDLSLPDKPSIVVLPFTNMSGDPEQEYFTDGVVEDIITALGRFHSLFVIARNSSFTYKGKAVDVRTVARELGVRYVLEGSIRRGGNRIRITAQLIDSLSGSHIWAERYDRVLEDVFAVQEEVTQSIVGAIGPQIVASELDRTRRHKAQNLSAYEMAVRAHATALESELRSDRALRDQGLAQAWKALEIDARNMHALNVVAWMRQQQVWLRTTPDPDAAWREGMDAAEKMIETDVSDSRGYMRKGQLLILATGSDRMDEALACSRTALDLNPNDARALNHLGVTLALAGDAKEAIGHLLQGLRVSPRDPMRHEVLHELAFAHVVAKDYASALDPAALAIDANPNVLWGHLWSTVARVGLGDLERAKSALRRARELAPEYVESRLNGQWVLRKADDRRRFTIFLRVAAGLEDPSAADALR